MSKFAIAGKIPFPAALQSTDIGTYLLAHLEIIELPYVYTTIPDKGNNSFSLNEKEF